MQSTTWFGCSGCCSIWRTQIWSNSCDDAKQHCQRTVWSWSKKTAPTRALCSMSQIAVLRGKHSALICEWHPLTPLTGRSIICGWYSTQQGWRWCARTFRLISPRSCCPCACSLWNKSSFWYRILFTSRATFGSNRRASQTQLAWRPCPRRRAVDQCAVVVQCVESPRGWVRVSCQCPPFCVARSPWSCLVVAAHRSHPCPFPAIHLPRRARVAVTRLRYAVVAPLFGFHRVRDVVQLAVRARLLDVQRATTLMLLAVFVVLLTTVEFYLKKKNTSDPMVDKCLDNRN